jgi:hypothetical protein
LSSSIICRGPGGNRMSIEDIQKWIFLTLFLDVFSAESCALADENLLKLDE